MATLHIVRHANTFNPGDTITRVGARTDMPLSSSGEAQVAALAAHFAAIDFTAAFCSPLVRTRQTARAILSARRAPPALLIAPFLTEIDYGEDENKAEADVIARIGQPALEAWDTHAVPPPGWQVDPAAITAAWHAVFARAGALPADANILIVTSNGIARFVLDAVDILPDGIERKLKTAAWGTVTVTPSGAALQTWNERLT